MIIIVLTIACCISMFRFTAGLSKYPVITLISSFAMGVLNYVLLPKADGNAVLNVSPEIFIAVIVIVLSAALGTALHDNGNILRYRSKDIYDA